MSNSDNPCMVCAVGQRCCKDMGLKLSQNEYERNFKSHTGRFSVLKYNKMKIVFPSDEQPCSYLTEKGCRIYQDRPIDCRLYPYELHRMVEEENRIEVVIYDQTDCPHKESLYIPIEEAKDLVRELARDVYGPDKPVEIHYRPGEKKKRPFGVFNPLVARLSKLLNARKS